MDINRNKSQFQIEQDHLLQTILNYRFIYPWKGITGKGDSSDIKRDAHLELYITNQCNQKCSYCYLTKHPELYPKHISNETILKNLRILYNYIFSNNLHIPHIDMFSGEIWQSQLGYDVLSLTLEYINKGMDTQFIMIPSNCSFVASDKTLRPIQEFIDKFHETGTSLIFSASIDGKYIDGANRPRNDPSFLYTDDFYERLFAFCKKNTFYFHPMVAAENISLWSDNYKWWIYQLEKYELNENVMMYLEVRNSDWTDEAIRHYCKLLITMMEHFKDKYCEGKIELLGNAMCGGRSLPEKTQIQGYIPWFLTETDNFIGCSAGGYMVVRIGDLAICPCHRTSYNKYLYGYFDVENDEIVGVHACNVQMAIKVLMTNFSHCIPVCDTCLYNDYCLRGCLGSQLETTGDPFFPSKNVCHFFHNKMNTLARYIDESGLLNYLKTFEEIEFGYENAQKIITICEKLKEANYPDDVGEH